MTDWWGIVWLVVLIVLNGFFVGAEFAVIASRRTQLEFDAKIGKPGSRSALRALDRTTLMLAICQLGVTVCSLIILGVSEPSIHHLLEAPLGALGWSEGTVDTVALVVTLVLVSFLHVVFGEMVPRGLALHDPAGSLRWMATPLGWLAVPLKPVTVALRATANGVVRLFGITPRGEAQSVYTFEEVEAIVDHAIADDDSKDEEDRVDPTGVLEAAFDFARRSVADPAAGVLVPFGDLVTLPAASTPADVEAAVAAHGYSRFVLVDGARRAVGYLHLKDVLGLADDAFEAPLPAGIARELRSVPADATLEDALEILLGRAPESAAPGGAQQAESAHLAAVVDPLDQVVGVVFLEDIVEALVGEVDDATND